MILTLFETNTVSVCNYLIADDLQDFIMAALRFLTLIYFKLCNGFNITDKSYQKELHYDLII